MMNHRLLYKKIKKNMKKKLEEIVLGELTLILLRRVSEPIYNGELITLLRIKFGEFKDFRVDAVIVRKLINKLRCDGMPILASNKGYWVSYDLEEIQIYIQSLDSRLEAIKSAKVGIENCLKNIEMINATIHP